MQEFIKVTDNDNDSESYIFRKSDILHVEGYTDFSLIWINMHRKRKPLMFCTVKESAEEIYAMLNERGNSFKERS